MWDALGIEPTRDVRAIRKAYAVRLRATDADADPAGFMALRSAFEAALKWAEGQDSGPAPPPPSARSEPIWQESPDVRPLPPPRPSEPDSDDDIANWGAIILPPLVHWTPAREQTAFSARLDAAVKEGRFGPLRDALRFGMARGLIALGQEKRYLAQLARAALDDPAVTLQDLDALEAEYSLSKLGAGLPDSLGPTLAARREAEVWWARMTEQSLRHFPLFSTPAARTGELMVGKQRPVWWPVRATEKALLETELTTLRNFAEFLGARARPERIDAIAERIRRTLYPTKQEETRVWLVTLAVLLGILGLLKLLPDG